jgi:hypothetical protein
MPPKANRKTVEKEKNKIIEDKTFGLKNKNKSKKVQQYVQRVAEQVKYKGRDHKDVKREEEERVRARVCCRCAWIRARARAWSEYGRPRADAAAAAACSGARRRRRS